MDKEYDSVAPYGVFQIVTEGKVVDFGIGVIHSQDKLVTFQKYFDETRKIGRIFFKKLSENVVFPLSYQLRQNKQDGYIIVNAESIKKLKGNTFVDITLDESDITDPPKFLSRVVLKEIDSGKFGYAIGFNKTKSNDILIHKTKFQLDTHIMDLRLKYQPAILFVFKQDHQFCYGFYEDLEDKSEGCDLYLSQELLSSTGTQRQALAIDNQFSIIPDNSQNERIIRQAQISSDQVYRYSLTRIWDESKGKILFILFNPSTADGRQDDHTIKRLIGFTKRWGYGGFYVGNIYAYRSMDPKQIRRVLNPEGPENRERVLELIPKVEKVVYAWGNHCREPTWLEVVEIPYCIAVSGNGIPKNPLYLRNDSELQVWRRR